MSRVLVNAKDKFKAGGKENAAKNALKKINDADEQATGAGGAESDEENLQYSVSSESD